MRFLIAAFLFFMTHSIHAQTSTACEPMPENIEVNETAGRFQKLLEEKKFSALDDAFRNRLARYKAGNYSDLMLYWVIHKTFDSIESSHEPLLEEWVRKDKTGLAARIFKATYHIKTGYKKRGTAFSNKTSDEQITAMTSAFNKALFELKAALEIDADSALVRANIISISKAIGGRENTLRWLDEAEKLDPRNQSARWAAIEALDERWGGDSKDLTHIETKIAQSTLPNAQKNILQWKIEMVRGLYLHYVTKEKTKSIAYYQKAAQLCDSIDTFWRWSAAAYEVENWEMVVKVTEGYLAMRPGSKSAHERRGWAWEKLGNMTNAVSDYEIATPSGSAWSQNRLGLLLAEGKSIPRDLPKARRLFEAAAAQGNETAKMNLQHLLSQQGQ